MTPPLSAAILAMLRVKRAGPQWKPEWLLDARSNLDRAVTLAGDEDDGGELRVLKRIVGMLERARDR